MVHQAVSASKSVDLNVALTDTTQQKNATKERVLAPTPGTTSEILEALANVAGPSFHSQQNSIPKSVMSTARTTTTVPAREQPLANEQAYKPWTPGEATAAAATYVIGAHEQQGSAFKSAIGAGKTATAVPSREQPLNNESAYRPWTPGEATAAAATYVIGAHEQQSSAIKSAIGTAKTATAVPAREQPLNSEGAYRPWTPGEATAAAATYVIGVHEEQSAAFKSAIGTAKTAIAQPSGLLKE